MRYAKIFQQVLFTLLIFMVVPVFLGGVAITFYASLGDNSGIGTGLALVIGIPLLILAVLMEACMHALFVVTLGLYPFVIGLFASVYAYLVVFNIRNKNYDGRPSYRLDSIMCVFVCVITIFTIFMIYSKNIDYSLSSSLEEFIEFIEEF